jgi:hypothetical protein
MILRMLLNMYYDFCKAFIFMDFYLRGFLTTSLTDLSPLDLLIMPFLCNVCRHPFLLKNDSVKVLYFHQWHFFFIIFFYLKEHFVCQVPNRDEIKTTSNTSIKKSTFEFLVEILLNNQNVKLKYYDSNLFLSRKLKLK